MSEELIKSLNGRVAELERAKANLEVALRGERKDRKALRDELDGAKTSAGTEADGLRKQVDDLTKDRDAWKGKAEAAPSEKDARIQELEAGLRTRDHRDAFARAVGADGLAEGFTVDDVWHHGGFDPSKAEKVDPAQITELLAKVRKDRPGLFAKPAAPGTGANPQAQGNGRPPLKVAADAGRGARDDASGTVRYTQQEVRQPGWMNTPRGRQILDARKAGTAEVVEA